MKYAATRCRITVVAASLFLSAAQSGLAEDASSPPLAMLVQGNRVDRPAEASSADADLGGARESTWLAQCRVGREALASGESQAPCWAWCILGVTSLTILGLFSFGWHEGHLPKPAEGIAEREEHGRDPVSRISRADGAIAAAAPTPGPAIDAPKLAGADVQLPDVVRPYYSVCVGLCGGGDVWSVACGA